MKRSAAARSWTTACWWWDTVSKERTRTERNIGSSRTGRRFFFSSNVTDGDSFNTSDWLFFFNRCLAAGVKTGATKATSTWPRTGRTTAGSPRRPVILWSEVCTSCYSFISDGWLMAKLRAAATRWQEILRRCEGTPFSFVLLTETAPFYFVFGVSPDDFSVYCL